MTVPGCLTTCPARSVRLTYSGGDCSIPGLGAPTASPNDSEKRDARARTASDAGRPDEDPPRSRVGRVANAPRRGVASVNISDDARSRGRARGDAPTWDRFRREEAQRRKTRPEKFLFAPSPGRPFSSSRGELCPDEIRVLPLSA